MVEDKNSITEIFKHAVKNHKENKLEVAQNLYNQVLKINPNHSSSHNNLGVLFKSSDDIQKAKEFFKKAIEIDPNYLDAHNNLGNIFVDLKEYQKALDCFKKAIEINPNYVDAYNNIGITYKILKEYSKAINFFEKVIEINPNYIDAYNNLGKMYFTIGKFHKAINSYEKIIKINPDYADAFYNLGLIYYELLDNQKAKASYERAIKINPNFINAYWNLHSLTSDIDEALSVLKKIYTVDKKFIKTKIMIGCLEYYKGNLNLFKDILTSSDSGHPHTRSIKWILSLPTLPKIFFNRCDFFDNAISLADNSRPFYEFGVWRGISFKYLIDTFKNGFGFDTFTGLPEAWYSEPIGTYSASGIVPKINGGEFIVGKFEDTLPEFFSKEKPLASLINFDADLYSSTLCALNYSNKVIDEKTILVFDEFIMNDNWEQDEFRALNEFCDNLDFSYEVIAVSFFTKQIAIKLKKN